MGRPKIIDNKKRIHKLTVHCTAKEAETIGVKAKKNKMSASRYLRETGISSDDTRLPKIRLETIHELKKIGVNINQMQHHINEVQKFGGSIIYQDILKKLKEFDTLLHGTIQGLRV